MAIISSISKNNVYYTLINGNVYACRFKTILVEMTRIGERNLDLANDYNDNELLEKYGVAESPTKAYPFRLKNSKIVLFSQYGNRRFSDLGIKCIVLEIAGGIGECTWRSTFGSDKFSPYKIYRSIEDCINEQDPVLIKGYNGKPAMDEPYEVSLGDTLPDNVFYDEPTRDIHGYVSWAAHTYQWDGTKSVKKRVNVKETHFGYKSAYSEMMLELLDGKFIFDEGYLDKCYATEEECTANNHVKVFTF